jgi:nucleotide-binding universal stress UspA family protein
VKGSGWLDERIAYRCNELFSNILVGLDGSSSSERALKHAIDLANAGNAKLTLITVAPPPATYVTLGGVSIETMTAELDKWALNVLEKAARLVPEELNAGRVQARGDAGHQILNEVKRGHYDLIVLGTRGRGRAQEGLLGSVNGYLHFHAHVPLLSVPDERTDEREQERTD